MAIHSCTKITHSYTNNEWHIQITTMAIHSCTRIQTMMAIHSCTKITHSYTNNDGNSFMY